MQWNKIKLIIWKHFWRCLNIILETKKWLKIWSRFFPYWILISRRDKDKRSTCIKDLKSYNFLIESKMTKNLMRLLLNLSNKFSIIEKTTQLIKIAKLCRGDWTRLQKSSNLVIVIKESSINGILRTDKNVFVV